MSRAEWQREHQALMVTLTGLSVVVGVVGGNHLGLSWWPSLFVSAAIVAFLSATLPPAAWFIASDGRRAQR